MTPGESMALAMAVKPLALVGLAFAIAGVRYLLRRMNDLWCQHRAAKRGPLT